MRATAKKGRLHRLSKIRDIRELGPAPRREAARKNPLHFGEHQGGSFGPNKPNIAKRGGGGEGVASGDKAIQLYVGIPRSSRCRDARTSWKSQMLATAKAWECSGKTRRVAPGPYIAHIRVQRSRFKLMPALSVDVPKPR